MKLRKLLRYLIALTLTTVLAGAVVVHAATTYTLTLLANTGDTIGGKTLTFVNFPEINNSGAVTFLGTFSGGEGIFTQDRLLVQTGDTIGGATLGAFQAPGINNSSTVAFYATCGASCFGVFTPSALLAAPGFTIDGKTLTSQSFRQGWPPIVPISDAGTVVFWATFDGSLLCGTWGSACGIFTQSTLVAQTGDTIGGRTLTDFGTLPAISHSGAVAFLGVFAGGSG